MKLPQKQQTVFPGTGAGWPFRLIRTKAAKSGTRI